MQKNVANQKVIIFVFNKNSGNPVLGDANNITGNIIIDEDSITALNDLHPIEIEKGYYYFELTQSETNGDTLLISASSTTTNVIVIGVPGVIFTEPTDRKYPASLNSSDVSGNLPANVKAKDDLDFGTLEKLSLNAATPASIQNIDADGSGFTALGDTRLENLDNKISEIDIPTVEEIREEIDDNSTQLAQIIEDIALIPTLGKGSKEVTYTLTKVDLTPIADANIKVTSDILGLYRIAEGRTNQSGIFAFQADAGSTVYIWRSKTGEVFVNPDVEIVPT